MLKAPHFNGDRPVESSEQDRLGFTASANQVAEAIQKFASPEGFVLGLEGAWGSGKSSYVNLIINALRKSGSPPEIVKFSPWLISSRYGLLGELFREVGKAALQIDLIEEEAPEEAGFRALIQRASRLRRHADREARRKRLSKALGAFAGSLARAGKLAEMAELLGVPYAGLAYPSGETGLPFMRCIRSTDRASG
jgi:predicted KAP-like P-loop ATPase